MPPKIELKLQKSQRLPQRSRRMWMLTSAFCLSVYFWFVLLLLIQLGMLLLLLSSLWSPYSCLPYWWIIIVYTEVIRCFISSRSNNNIFNSNVAVGMNRVSALTIQPCSKNKMLSISIPTKYRICALSMLSRILYP